MKPRGTIMRPMKTNLMLVVLSAAASLRAAEAADADRSMRGPVKRRAHDGALEPLLADAAHEPPRVLQKEVEAMAARANKLPEKAGAEFDAELENIEVALAKRAAMDTDLANEIRSVRARLCTKQGFLVHQAEDCDAFMRRSCAQQVAKPVPHAAADVEEAPKPADEVIEDTDDEDSQSASLTQLKSVPQKKGLPVVSLALCEQYFREEAAAKSGMTGDEEDEGKKKDDEKEKEEGDDEKEEGDDEKKEGWFDKKEGPLPEQGFKGKKIEHNDLKTSSSDWQEEFGPAAGHRTAKEICQDFKDNEWCRLHGYYDKPAPPKKEWWEGSAAPAGGRTFVAVAAILAFARVAPLA